MPGCPNEGLPAATRSANEVIESSSHSVHEAKPDLGRDLHGVAGVGIQFELRHFHR